MVFNLPEIKDEVFVVNINEYELVKTHWTAVYLNCDNVTRFERF